MRSQRYKIPNKLDLNPASKRQIDYAISLGIELPEGATVSDASALIDRVLDNDVQASKELMEYAQKNHIVYSKYVGNKFLHKLLFDHLEGEEKAIFFCLCVYKFYTNPIYKPEDRTIFEDFAKYYSKDTCFKVSMDEYEGDELVCFGKSTKIFEDGTKRTLYGGSIHTTAFKKAYKYLKDCNMLT